MMAKSFIVVIFAFIAVASADIPEFSPEALDLLYLTNLESIPIKVNLINFNIDMEFLQGPSEGVPSHTTAYLRAHSLPQLKTGKPHEICGNALGIEISDTSPQRVFCNLTGIVLEEDDHQNVDAHMIQLGLIFESDTTPMLVLDVPVFKIPSKFASAEEEEDFKTWRNQNEVGVSSSLDLEKFRLVRKGETISLDFKWLNELLKYGITKSSRTMSQPIEGEEEEGDDLPKEIEIDWYIARPIVMTEGAIDEFITTIRMFNPIKP